jgi:4-methylaminobutanoate oxidase (formaldehyde-forming)
MWRAVAVTVQGSLQRLTVILGCSFVGGVAGGGIIGCSVAYHLAHLGQNVVLLEKDQLTSGTTWHAAGLCVTFGSLSETSTEMRKYTRDLYSQLEAETGQATGLAQVGFIELAPDKDYLEEYRRISAFNRKCGIDVQELSPSEVGELFPLCKTDDLLAGFYVADDGRVNPVDAAMALSKGARAQGARIFEGVTVAGVSQEQGRVTGVHTADGQHIAAEYVVNCAGMWVRAHFADNVHTFRRYYVHCCHNMQRPHQTSWQPSVSSSVLIFILFDLLYCDIVR